ncbi:hypothetical protein M406DRAFT_247864 [Cryphonectria parasitica EP155]|uniref:Uncharacterized protein n=1 Tax=Cryphonectria parasitica (strain ATCC 38755 / EP155) TaxID=660469 RepID=A0A9P5CUP3_CRYP1|nr:uncharacterized protein M406DRAFT_247864 [Cryphonectria parasitica EP155]KAF3770571.1 hypothetical protein M406DRAFT_247864 [Cryphonectria parasitica EP155]
MGSLDSWVPIHSTTLRERGHPDGDGGEGDSAGGPHPARNIAGAWPTLVIEAGVTESMAQLRLDMQWWFRASDHQVKIVIIIKLNRDNNQIILEKYQETPTSARLGATTTRASIVQTNGVLPEPQQRINITRNVGTPPSYHVARGALILSFRLLFLRDPGPDEGDIVLGVPELQIYAARVWAILGE